MKRIISNEKFKELFSNIEYRRKLDQVILNFFGLDTTKPLNEEENFTNSIFLEFILFINTEYILKISVKDTQKLFNHSKQFYINISFREVERYHQLLMPCFWEIYSPYSLKNLNNNKLYLIAALLSANNMKEIEYILFKLHIFSKVEIANIIEAIKN